MRTGAAMILPEKFMTRARQCADQMIPLIERMEADFKTYVIDGSINFYAAPAVAFIFIDECFLTDRMVGRGRVPRVSRAAAAGHGWHPVRSGS